MKRAFSCARRIMRELYDTMLIGESRGTIALEQYLAAIIESVLDLFGSKVTLEVQDNGVGLPEGFSLDHDNGFGTMLVKMLSEQLYAQLLIESRAGTLVRLQFTPG
ncbi:MAG: hypothetical protein ABR590_10390 [Spirochaetia bacterium]